MNRSDFGSIAPVSSCWGLPLSPVAPPGCSAVPSSVAPPPASPCSQATAPSATLPLSSTARQSEREWHATPLNDSAALVPGGPPTLVTCQELAPRVGCVELTTSPAPSAATHRTTDAHDTPVTPTSPS